MLFCNVKLLVVNSANFNGPRTKCSVIFSSVASQLSKVGPTSTLILAQTIICNFLHPSTVSNTHNGDAANRLLDSLNSLISSTTVTTFNSSSERSPALRRKSNRVDPVALFSLFITVSRT